MRLCFQWLLIAVIGAFAIRAKAESAQDMTQRLADLRAEIEAVNVEIETMKRERQAKIDALLARKVELETEKVKETGRRIQVDTKLGSLEKRMSRMQARSTRDRERLRLLIDRGDAYLEGAIPIEIKERRKELQAIRAEVTSGEANLESSLVSLWKWLDRELQRTVDTRIVSQEIEIEGAELGSAVTKNAEVLAIGTVAALFADTEGRVGRAYRSVDTWNFRYFDDQKDRNAALVAFESVRSRKSPGFIELPLLSVVR